jgi:hypothetical protein
MRIRARLWAAAGAAAVLVAGVCAHATIAATLTASLPKAVLTVSPTAVSLPGDGPGGCFGTNGVTWVCTFKVSESSGSSEPLTWRATVALDSSGAGRATKFNPAGGTLYPGTTVTVKATVGCEQGMAFLITSAFVGWPETSGAAVYYMECG